MDKILARLIERLDVAGPPQLRGKYHAGELVYTLNLSELPLASVRFLRTDVDYDTSKSIDDAGNPINGTVVTHQVEIAVVTDYMSDPDINSTKGYNKLTDIIESKTDSYNFAPNSLIGFLSNVDQIDPNVFLGVNQSPAFTIDYDTIFDQGPNKGVVRARVTFNINYYQQ